MAQYGNPQYLQVFGEKSLPILPIIDIPGYCILVDFFSTKWGKSSKREVKQQKEKTQGLTRKTTFSKCLTKMMKCSIV